MMYPYLAHNKSIAVGSFAGDIFLRVPVISKSSKLGRTLFKCSTYRMCWLMRFLLFHHALYKKKCFRDRDKQKH